MFVSKNKGTPKWMVKIMEIPIKNHDLGAPLFLETHWKHPGSTTLKVGNEPRSLVLFKGWKVERASFWDGRWPGISMTNAIWATFFPQNVQIYGRSMSSWGAILLLNYHLRGEFGEVTLQQGC